MPPDFFGAEVGRAFDVAVPLAAEPMLRGRDSAVHNGGTTFLTVIARLRRDESAEAATAALRAAQPQIREATLGENGQGQFATRQSIDRYLTTPFALLPAATGASDLRLRYERPLLTILVVAALVLLIACANIANLSLARATARRHELSLRLALGASRWRLVRQLLTESLVLSTTGAAFGMAIAAWSSRVLVRQISTSANTVFLDLSIDWHVLAFTAGIAALTTMCFGTAPAFRTSGVAPMDALKEHGRATVGPTRGATTDWLVVAQVALSLVLVVAAGLFIRTFLTLRERPLGFSADHVLLVGVDASRTIVDPAERLPMYERSLAARPRSARRRGRGAVLDDADRHRSVHAADGDDRTAGRHAGSSLGQPDLARLVRHLRHAAGRRTRPHEWRSQGSAAGGGGQRGVRAQAGRRQPDRADIHVVSPNRTIPRADRDRGRRRGRGLHIRAGACAADVLPAARPIRLPGGDRYQDDQPEHQDRDPIADDADPKRGDGARGRKSSGHPDVPRPLRPGQRVAHAGARRRDAGGILRRARAAARRARDSTA